MVEEASAPGWLDDNPFFLLILLDDGRTVEIDLGERGWIAKYHEQGFLRSPGKWFLIHKARRTVAIMQIVHDGDQPYYVARHVGSVGIGGPAHEVTVYGIGKKRPDGSTDRAWVLPNGCLVVGEDVEEIAIWMLRQGHL